ncbi:MAG TPA: glycoside hydrolase family 2 TIM barrel-domain containing protein [Candidatus Brocadiia bacterium]|nr:glycoside hydrolase family 2 TIM barrel-domain containing protein [Candidatus Brocadiia bacterium]
MKNIPLKASWQLSYPENGAAVFETPEQLATARESKPDAVRTVPATVPGNCELDLVAAGILPEPFVGMGVKLLRPFEFKQWWYECEFAAPPETAGKRVELLFHGVDCLATYWLNGQLLGSSDNMFIEHAFDVTGMLKAGGNRLIVRIDSSVLAAQEKHYDPYVCAQPTGFESIWIRKAPHSYGWDIMPRVVSAGIWRPVELVVHEATELLDLYFATMHADEGYAHIRLHYTFRTDCGDLDGFSLRVSGRCGESSFSETRELRFCAGEVGFGISSPKLWWPQGYGDPNIYEATVELLHRGKVVDKRAERFGVRTVELVRTEVTRPDKPGEFIFKINGCPILAKGSNWVPADAFHSRDAERYERILALFNDLGCNILRCWGGNVYEDHKFYNLCDAYGIMVWQDFAMACALYPQDAEFQDAMRKEARAVVRKLRRHPCIILWSGDNECDMVLAWRGASTDPNSNVITRKTLPEVVRSVDPYRPYLPSSPYYSPEAWKERNENLMPEQHPWGPRDYYKSRSYTEITAHFCSEIGYHGCPNVSSIKKFIEPDHLWPCLGDEQWILHCSDPVGADGPYAYRVKLMSDQIKEMFGFEPDNLEDFALASQISQAEAKKFFIEMIRLGKWRRTGVIWWNVMDGWPQFSDAVVDYYFGRKLAYHFIKRVQNPVCLMISEPDSWHVRLSACNDSRKDAEGKYRVWDSDSGKTLAEGEFRVGANSNRQLAAIRCSRGDQRLYIIEWTIAGQTFGNHYMLGTPPIDFTTYMRWLEIIAALPPGFDLGELAR